MNSKMVGLSKLLGIICLVIFIVSSIVLCSFESNLNVNAQDVQIEIDQLQSDIESLNLHIQKSSSFAKIEEVASKNGYAYSPSSVTAATNSNGE